jgi:hypothetical protein
MQPYQIEVEAHPTPHDGQFLADQLYTYNVEQTGYDDGKYLTLSWRTILDITAIIICGNG